MQNGAPVPDFGWQPRPRIDLGAPWRVERVALDEALTMSDRGASLQAIEREADGRQLAEYDDAGWDTIDVPGTINPPPAGEEGGAWYRREVEVPPSWAGDAVTIRFASANAVADVWLNGTWLGVHEGGSTPFALEAGEALHSGSTNVLAVRVHTIPLGTRSDTIPWGLVDWWNYGGLTGPVWLEAAPATHLVRADVVPHLDAIDISVVLHATNRPAGQPAEVDAPPPSSGSLRLSIFPATVTDANLTDPDPRSLVPDRARPLAFAVQRLDLPSRGSATVQGLSVLFGDADEWSPSSPALYVLRVQLVPTVTAATTSPPPERDELWTTFGIRHVTTDPDRPAVMLNGAPAFFRGVGIHDESLTFGTNGELVDGSPAPSVDDLVDALREAAAVGANFIRAGHLPADPTLLMLADRLGFAVWEEIPLYHATPLIFDRTMRRGIPQQMLREMALRDMNHPSVLFHGFANESTGDQDRTDALAELAELDRAIDGTRLTGQAAYGWRPSDPTQDPLDVAGFTMYHGVFYGEDPDADTRRALREAHEANPTKPIVVLEFGRWADTPSDELRQRAVFEDTYRALARYRADRPGGFVSVATWWSLRDFATQLGAIGVEEFGLYRPDGSLRPAGNAATAAFSADAGQGADQRLEPDIDRPRVRLGRTIGDWTLVGYLGYALAVSIAIIGGTVLVLTRRGGRATGRTSG
jgi:beta-glucuronidase